MLMFGGRAEEAIVFYTALFTDSSVESIERYRAEHPGPEGQIVHARFRLGGRLFLATDSHIEQPYTFTPSTSFFVECADEDEIDRLAAALSEGGAVLMPLGAYPFASRYAWVQDRFGLSWQLMLA
jgi:predicted 3-demethylubiquinone-9 3-methyltransferase (glyoxalase superfamily)